MRIKLLEQERECFREQFAALLIEGGIRRTGLVIGEIFNDIASEM